MINGELRALASSVSPFYKIKIFAALSLTVFTLGNIAWRSYGPMPAAPRIASNTALRPYFLLSDGRKFAAGTAVCVRTRPGAAPLLLTALHLFGPAGGLKANIAPEELDARVKAVAASDLSRGHILALARGTATHGGYPMTAQGDVSGDVVAFRVASGSKSAVLPLAPPVAIQDSWVWMVGDTSNNKKPQQRIFPARVETLGSNFTTIRFQEDFPLTAFSGAPILNGRGEVAGLLIGGNGRLGTIISSRLIHKHLMAK